MSLKDYILTRILLAIPMMFILLIVIFFVLRIIPGDPVLAILGGKAPQEVIDQKRHELGLDKPIIIQFFDYVGDLLKGDLGKSTLTSRPVWNEIKDRFPATVELTLFAFIVAVLIGVFWEQKRRPIEMVLLILLQEFIQFSYMLFLYSGSV
nr:ABC transporter permease [Marinitoga lauensis]